MHGAVKPGEEGFSGACQAVELVVMSFKVRTHANNRCCIQRRPYPSSFITPWSSYTESHKLMVLPEHVAMRSLTNANVPLVFPDIYVYR